jgi:CheY-like chemotaxis protein
MINSLHTLVVEDSPIAQRVMTIQMTQQGCQVDLASDGAMALEKAMRTRYDVILMDIGLGDGPDGFEVTAQIKELCPLNKATPVMAVTAHNEPEFREKALEYGMIGYFNKPFTPDDAQIVIDTLKDTL